MRLKAELTPREGEIAELLAWGASKKEIADRLFISARTVENTARNIYAKIGIQKATELCVWWFCTKCGVPVSLDPLKRAFIATTLLLVVGFHEFNDHNDDTYLLRATRTAATRVARAGRRVKDENKDINPFNNLIA